MMLKSNKDIFNEYLSYLQAEKGIAETTRSIYLRAAETFYSLLHQKPEAMLLSPQWDWQSVDRRAVEMFFNHLRNDRGWQEVSIRQQASALRYFFNHLRKRGYIDRVPIKRLFPKAHISPPEIPEGEEAAVVELFARSGDSLKEARLLALLELIYGGGIRPTQVYALKSLSVGPSKVLASDGKTQGEFPLSREGVERIRNYLKLRKNTLSPRGKKSIPPKGSRTALPGAPLPGGAEAPLSGGTEASPSGRLGAPLPGGPDPLWINHHGVALGVGGLSRSIRKAMEEVGLEGGGRLLRQLSARHFRERGGDIRSLKQFLGMKRMGALEKFAGTEFQQLHERFRKFHPRQGDGGK